MPHFDHENRIRTGRAAPFLICGVDEVGRGPLAGPVVAAAVILDPHHYPDGLNDSKKLSEKGREALFPRIMETALAVGIGACSVAEIDQINIRRATHLAMARAVEALSVPAHFALVDGNDAPALPCPCETIIKGDSISLSIAAASIIAKVTRDRQMIALHAQHPHYNWRSNKGYGTRDHMAGLQSHGVTPHHRKSFSPIHNILYGDESGTQFPNALIQQDS